MPALRPRLRLRPLLALLVALPTALLGVVASSVPAHACSCAPLTFKQQVNRADVVLVGEVSAEPVSQGPVLTYDVVADRVFKGELASSATQVSTAADPAACGLGELLPGETYLFLLKEGSTSVCQGSAPASTDVLERVQRQLGIGTRLEPPAPPEATRTRLEDSPPQSLGRLVAPGAAMVLLGLLGLVVVRRVGRA